MADPRFFMRAGPRRLADIADICGGELAVGADPERLIEDVAPLQTAGERHISFLDNRKYLSALEKSSAGACLLHPDTASRAPDGMQLVLTGAPYRAYALVAQAFYPEPPFEAGVAPSAIVDSSAVLGSGCLIEAGAIIGAGVEIGMHCRIGPNAIVGDRVTIGNHSTVGANASLSHCFVGSRVIIYPGARVGQPGFGFAIDPTGHVKVPQLGRVIIEDDVEVGANSTVDRGSGSDTVIGAGTMIDNLVHIGHNVRIGRGCVIAGLVGVSGSSELGDMVIMGGQGGVAGHLKVGSGAQIAAQAGILRDVAPGERVMGTPARPLRQFFRQIATLEKIARKSDASE